MMRFENTLLLAFVIGLCLSFGAIAEDTAIDYSKLSNSQLQQKAKADPVAGRTLAERLLGLDGNMALELQQEGLDRAILLLRAASGRDLVAANMLGGLIGSGVAKAEYEGEELALYQFTAKLGDETGKVNLAVYQLFSDDVQMAIKGRESLQNLAVSSNSRLTFVALRALSTAMLFGIGGEQEVARGIKGYEIYLQFDPEDASVLSVLGKAEQYGWASEKNIPKAISYYQRAGNAGSSEAMWQMGMIYLTGDGVQKDEAKAWNLVVHSSDAGFEDALISRAVMLSLGQGTDQNFTEAYQWYEKVAAKGRAHALRSMGYMNLMGQGRDKNPVLAWAFYDLAAAHDEIAEKQMADMNIDQLEPTKKSQFLSQAATLSDQWLRNHGLTRADIY